MKSFRKLKRQSRRVSLAGGNVFVNYLQNVRSSVKVFDGEGKPLRDIVFPSLGTVGSVYGRWDSGEAFFQFTSFHIPTTIYRYGVADGKQEVWARLNVPIESEAIDVNRSGTNPKIVPESRCSWCIARALSPTDLIPLAHGIWRLHSKPHPYLHPTSRALGRAWRCVCHAQLEGWRRVWREMA